MSDLGDTLYCTAEDDDCCGSLTLVGGELLCSFHRVLHEMMRLPCPGDTHNLFESEDEALEYLKASFDHDDPDSMCVEYVDLPSLCSYCTYKAEKDD
jgi:hypothetical protein